MAKKTPGQGGTNADETAELLRIGRLIHGAILAARRRDQLVDYCMRQFSDDRAYTSLENLVGWGKYGKLIIENGLKETGVLCGEQDDFYTYGRNLYAAVWAAKRGYRSVDNVIKNYLPDRIDCVWRDCALSCVDGQFHKTESGLILLEMPNPTIQ